jgi:hypothetical protein
MRRIVRALVPFTLLLMSACDPGITIRQTLSRAESAATPGVVVQVATSHPFIGESSYAPVVTVTNSSDSLITITAAELVIPGSTYANKPRRTASYPLAVPPGKSDTLDIWFEVNSGVKKAFRVPAEWRVHYTSGDKDQIAHATLVGEPLNTQAP